MAPYLGVSDSVSGLGGGGQCFALFAGVIPGTVRPSVFPIVWRESRSPVGSVCSGVWFAWVVSLVLRGRVFPLFLCLLFRKSVKLADT